MKRILCWGMAFVLLLCIFPVSANAVEMETIYLEDGSYITVQIEPVSSRASGTKTGNKVYTHYDSDDSSNWKAVLTGTFTYTGSSASCTASRVNVTIYDSSWYVVSEDAQKSENKATASVTMGQKALGVTVNKVPVSLTLSCDANGNLS